MRPAFAHTMRDPEAGSAVQAIMPQQDTLCWRPVSHTTHSKSSACTAIIFQQVQNAAKKVRRHQAEISDVQATLNEYAAKVQSPSSKASSATAAAAGCGAAAGAASTAAAGGGSAAGAGDVYDELKPGDFVWVPSFVEADQLMKVQLLKVRYAVMSGNKRVWPSVPACLPACCCFHEITASQFEVELLKMRTLGRLQ
jgi:hypothetical protein